MTPDDRWVVAGASYQQSTIWDLHAPKPYNPRGIPWQETFVRTIVTSPDKRWMATGSWAKIAGTRGICIFDLQRADPFAEAAFSLDIKSVASLAFDQHGSTLMAAAALGHGASEIIRLKDQKFEVDDAAPQGFSKCVALTRNGRQAFTAWDTKLHTWDLSIEDLLTTARKFVGDD